MPQLIAVHEIHRPGKNGKPEVIAPGKPFSANADEVKFFVDQTGAARRPSDEDRIPQLSDNEDGDSQTTSTTTTGGEVKVEDMTVPQLTEKAKELGLEIPANAKKPEILKLVQDKLAADGGLI